MSLVEGCSSFKQVQDGNRREFLRAGSLGLLGLNLPTLLNARELSPAPTGLASTFGRAKACIILFMWGGPAQQDTWDLKPDAPEQIRGEFRPIATSVPGIAIATLVFHTVTHDRSLSA